MKNEKTETKEQQIERLKNNWLPYCALSKDDQELIAKMRNKNNAMHLTAGGFFRRCNSPNHQPVNHCVYRIDPDYQLPKTEHVAPEGYRIVSMEDRKRLSVPKDCQIMLLSILDDWIKISNLNHISWSSEYFTLAVPSDYIFAEDRTKKKFGWVEYPVTKEGDYWRVIRRGERQMLHTCISMIGFGGIKFETSSIFSMAVYNQDTIGKIKHPVAVQFWEEVK